MKTFLTSEEVRELESEETEFFYLRGVADCAEWSLERYPVSSLWTWGEKALDERERAEIQDWWQRESARDPRYFRRFEARWKQNPDEFPPIIIAELPDGRIDIGDGWHRIAMAAIYGPSEIQAIVGRRCGTARKR